MFVKMIHLTTNQLLNMSTFTIVFLCIQACLVQHVFSICPGSYGSELAGLGMNYGAAYNPAASYGYGAGIAGPATISQASYGFGAGFTGPAYSGYGYQAAGLSPYGGAGEGNVGVVGEMPVAGNTAVAGQVPIMGTIGFNGGVPAAGAVSISGNCACGCGGPYQYQY